MDARLADARLYLVTPPIEPARLRAALDGGVDVVQLRMKDAEDDAAILREADWMLQACETAGVPFVLNDRPDLAAACGAHGVHVGQDDASVTAARTALGPGAIVGLSTHAPDQLAAADPSASYVAVGPVFATPTKPGRPAVGLEYVRHAATHAPPARPWFAIGGIDQQTVGAVVEAGARRIVVVRAIVEAGDPAASAAALKAALPQEAPVGIA